MENLERLIKQGIVWEDEFVAEYLKIIENDDFMEFFGENKVEAKQLLDIMITESKEHKDTLEKLFGEIT